MEKSGKIHAPKDARVVDATGKFLIPGLWDMHVHWYDKDYLALFIANGVTGVRVMSGAAPIHYEWRKEVEQGSLLGPRMLIASPIGTRNRRPHGQAPSPWLMRTKAGEP